MKTISVKNIKENTLLFNDKALKSTENIILTSFEKIEKVQNKTEDLLTKGFKYSEKKQDFLFQNLENGKETIWKNLNKVLDFFGKK